MKKRLPIILLIFLLIGVGLYFYINNVFLPVKLKSIIEEKAHEFLKRKVTIGKIHYEPVRGIVIDDINIADNNANPFVNIKSVSFNVLLAPILKNKNIIIPTVNIDEPSIHIVRLPLNQWNFSDLIAAPDPSAEKPPYTVLLRKLIINRGQFIFTDNTLETPFTQTLTNTNLQVVLSLDQQIDINFSTLPAGANSAFNLKGAFIPASQELNASVTLSNLELIPYLKNYAPQLGLQKGNLSYGDVKISYSPESIVAKGNLTLNDALYRLNEQGSFHSTINITNADIHWQNNELAASADISLPKSVLKLTNEQMVQGDINANITSIKYGPGQVNLTGSLSSPNLEIALNKNQQLNTALNATNISIKQANDVISINSALKLENSSLSMGEQEKITFSSLSADKLSLNISGPVIDINTPLSIKTIDVLWGKIKSTIEQLDTSSVNVSLKESATTLNSTLSLQKLQLTPDGTIEFSDNPKIEINVSLANDSPDIKGTVSLTNATATGLPEINTVSNINGDVSFSTDEIKIEKLGLSAHKTNFTVNGTINNFANPNANLRLSSENINLADIYPLIEKYVKQYNVQATGNASLTATVKGPLSDIANAEISAITTLNETTVSSPAIPNPVENISGEISYNKNHVAWRKLKGSFLGQNYTIDGEMNDFSQPKINTTVSTKDINLKTEINVLRQAFQINSFSGTYFNSSIDLKGDVHLKDKAPDIDLRGTFALALNDLSNISPEIKKQLESYKLNGTLRGKALFKGAGDPNEWKNWAVSVDATSSKISAMGYDLNDVTLTVEQRDRYISKLDLNGLLFNGNLSFKSSVDLASNDMPMIADFLIENLDLNEYRKAQKMLQQFAGTLNMATSATIPLLNTKLATGKGSIVISNGYIYLPLISQLSNFNFTDGQMTFTIKDGKVVSDNLRLISQQVIINGFGEIDFDGNYKFNIKPETVSTSMIDAGDIQINPNALLGSIASVNCSGNATSGKKPNCTALQNIIKTPVKIIEGVGGILQGILQ